MRTDSGDLVGYLILSDQLRSDHALADWPLGPGVSICDVISRPGLSKKLSDNFIRDRYGGLCADRSGVDILFSSQ